MTAIITRRNFYLYQTFTFLLLFLVFVPVYSQDWAKTNISNMQRADMRDLGYPMVNEIPANSTAITSLLTASDGKIYGGTSGEVAYIFMFDPVNNKVKHLGNIPGHEAVHHSMVEDKDGYIYIGTGKNMFDEITLSKWGSAVDESVDKILWKDIKDHFSSYKGGHLYRYDPKKSNNIVKLSDMQCDLEDLGVPLVNNSIYALTINTQGTEIYGITYPDGHFFIYNIQNKKFNDLGEIDQKIVFHGPERFWRSLSRALVCDNNGKVYMSGTNGIIRYYSPQSGKIIDTEMKIPGDYYYIQFFTDYAVVDYFAKDNSGLIYGGTSDGYLFSINPSVMKLSNHGKVRSTPRLRCLTVADNGKVYMMAGERSTSRPCQFYSYDPQTAEFEDLGLFIVDRSPYYYWRGQQFDAMVKGIDGTIYLGESERRSHLFLFIPE